MEKVTLNNAYQSKIKTLDQLKETLGPFPRDKKVIMCHGTFDIVHPGHIRHLIYAKNKADVLVASLTCDEYIKKANYRPYIPQELRAINLAALEIVDYVVIDNNETPIQNLKEIQPDYFAKGSDYVTDTGVVNPKTQEEIQTVEGYGGEIIFTPGDVVFSSSHIIEELTPKMSEEKLSVLMDSEGVSFKDLHETVDRLKEAAVHIVGDTIVDTYTYTTLIGGGTKTPTLSVRRDTVQDYTGGAAIVAKHMRSTGARVKFTTVLGDDELKDFVLNDLKEAGVELNHIVDSTRPTTRKNVIIANKHRLLKVDDVDNRSISDKILDSFTSSIESSESYDGIVFSDFRHGIFNQGTIPKLTKAIPAKCIKVADTQVASRWGNILEFQGFDLLTPNEKEARFALGDQESVVRPLALKLKNQAECKYLMLKMGSRGMLTYREGSETDPKKFFTMESFTNNAIDPVGSGDALLSYATLSLIVSKSIVISSILGNVAAALACEQDGNKPVNPQQMHDRLSDLERRINFQ